MTAVPPVRRALLSVHDKTGLAELARGLAAAGVELISTGGSARILKEAGLAVREVSDVTGFPEMMAGRVKTLHPKIHGGILARRGTDEAALAAQGIAPIDLVVVNLYPFERSAAREDASEAETTEMIDIGGPAMLRAAAKNWKDVAVLCDPGDYAAALAHIERNGGLPEAERRRLAAKVFARTAAYDAAIAAWFARGANTEEDAAFPAEFAPCFERRAMLRYGENPHQRAALYGEPGAGAGTVVAARQLQGKPLSFNNLADADAALGLVMAFDASACVIVKHLNPCGVAIADSSAEAYARAYACDPASAFGGIVAFNTVLEADVVRGDAGESVRGGTARARSDGGSAGTARDKTESSRAGCRHSGASPVGHDYRRLAGGLLVQDADRVRPLNAQAEVVSRRAPDAGERESLDFAWRVVQAVRSNAIVIARKGATLGIGAGQMSRVDAVRIAGMKAAEANHPLAGSVLASDAFFPFRDNVDEAARLGVRAIVQPGGSRRDKEVIAAADEHGVAMIFTRERHFRH